MKRAGFVFAIMTVLILCSQAEGFTNVIKNGSFEDNGIINNITPGTCPDDWNDVNLPATKFLGYVFYTWSSDGEYSLTLYSRDGDREFDVNEIGMISQHVPLTREVNEITFDMRVRANSGGWDPNMRTAVVCIDNKVMWQTNDVDVDYFGSKFVVPEEYKDGQTHRLSLGIRIDSNALVDIKYYADWDDVNSTTYCDGSGLLAGDLNRDCYVDFFDLAMLAEVWLAEVQPNSELNLFGGDDLGPGGFINFRDFALYAGSYTGDMNDFAGLTDIWLEEVELDNEYNLYSGDDLEPNGVINFFDFAVFAEDWGAGVY